MIEWLAIGFIAGLVFGALATAAITGLIEKEDTEGTHL